MPLFVLLVVPAQAGDINATTCSSADVQTALDSAVDSDRVLIPSGNCTWSVQVTVTNKGITVQGAGIGVTTITNGLAAGETFNIQLQSGDPTFILTAFTFDGNSLDTGSKPFVNLKLGGLDAFRIHGNDFINLNGSAILYGANTGAEVSGLIDNNTFTMDSGSGSNCIQLLGAASGMSAPFARGLELGSEKFIFVEDNTFTFTAREDGAMDSFAGIRYVFRHNTITDTNVEHHGADSGGFRGIHSCEIYSNTFDSDAVSQRMLFFRSGTCMVYDNAWTGNYGTIDVSNFRSRPESFAPWGSCDTTSSWDENAGPPNGYACLDQIGHIFTDTTGGSNVLWGSYFWNNTLDAAQVTVVLVSEASMDDYLVDDREYYSFDAAFDGTSGIGRDTLANRPATCTPVVGYWTTDESKFYRCTATDTWTFYYEAFTYPHPLQSQVRGQLERGIPVTAR